jgi:hypothetical protein
MYIQALRHKQNKKKFLRLVNDGRSDPRYQMRLLESKVPQLIPGKKTLGSLLGFYKQPGWMSPENIKEIRDNYEFVEVTLSYPND